jgi:anti-sigma factor RsiW
MQHLIAGYQDGELDLVRNLEVEQHLQSCSSCSRAFQNQKAVRSAMTTGSFYYRSPAYLQKRVLSAVRKANKPETSPWFRQWSRLGAGASLAAAALLALILVPGLIRQSADDVLVQETISAHVRSLMASHLTDVSSSDQHTVKPWFNGKLDFSPPVTDLTEHGFPLVGGRLEYLGDRPVAALVYRRQQHFINLFIWPAKQDAAQKAETRQGYHVIRWAKSGMTYWAVSDLNAPELQEFARLISL